MRTMKISLQRERQMMNTQAKKWRKMQKTKTEEISSSSSNSCKKATTKMTSNQKWRRKMTNLKAMAI